MNTYGNTSEKRLAGVHPDLVFLAREVLKHHDAHILCGARTQAEQAALFNAKPPLTRTMLSKHLIQPDGFSHAIDIAPWVNGAVPWDNMKYFYHFAGMFLVLADQAGIAVRWGGDWNNNHDLDDQTFMDLVHFEKA